MQTLQKLLRESLPEVIGGLILAGILAIIGILVARLGTWLTIVIIATVLAACRREPQMGWSQGFSRGRSDYFRPRPAEAWTPKRLSDKLLGLFEPGHLPEPTLGPRT